MRATLLAAALLALPLGTSVRAQPARTPVEVHSLGPQVGERVPDFSLPGQNGQVWTRDSIMGEQGAMIVFHRSADW